MNFEQRPEQRLEHRLNAQLILNLKLLALPIQELSATIELALEHNPALEQSEQPLTEQESFTLSNEPATMETEPIPVHQDPATGEEFTLTELLPPDGWTTPSPDTPVDTDDDLLFSEGTEGSYTRRDALLPLLLAELPPEDSIVAEQVIEWLDDDGRLTVSDPELAEVLGASQDQIQRILTALKRIPPGGIGCQTTREILLTQLELKGTPKTATEYRLISEAWEMLLHHHTNKLTVLLGVNEKEIQQSVDKILLLDPRPARQFTSTVTPYVLPDFSIEWQGDRLIAVVCDDRIPRLRVAKHYLDIVQNPRNYSLEEVRFAREKVQNGLMFLRAVESRRNLMRRLVELILQRQKEFFLNGRGFLKPATLKQAAQELDVNPSTISRAIAGKYIETPFGIFPVKEFFQSGKGGLSRQSIKQKIKVLIETENKTQPITDEHICSSLALQGIKISRRTVAKYRSELGIPGSEERRRS